MNKKILFFGLLLLIVTKTYSQQERVLNLPNFDKPIFHYGFYLGLNKNSFKIAYQPNKITDNPNITINPEIGFNLGLIADLKLNNNINLRFEPGLISNKKTLTFNHISGNENEREREAGNTYLHLPIIFKFSTNRLNNIRPYVLGGVSYDLNFSSNEKSEEDNFYGEFRQKSNIFMYEIGIGIDFYLPYFKFSPSIRGIFAINNELKYDDKSPSQWTDPINYMGTRGIFLHLAFE
ncbi:MAG: PorT family protein [Tenacibaculum sp.]|nr:PorT family protein [Tenacibaculum sp.]